MDKVLVLRVRGCDEISDIVKLPLAHLHSRIIRDSVLVDTSEVEGECLISILESGRRYGDAPQEEKEIVLSLMRN